MPKKINKRNKTKKNNKTQKNKKQKQIIMIGCSKKNKKSCKNKKSLFSPLANNCPNCGPNCHCGPNCDCPHPCPGTCYLNRHHKGGDGQGQGQGCGSCGCPLSPYSWNKMDKIGGSYQNILQNGGNQLQPIPPPTVGSPWGMNNLPGQSGIPGDGNYFKPYDTDKNPQLQLSMNNAGYKTLNSMVGGKKTRVKRRTRVKRSENKRGGGFSLIPQDLMNLGRAFNYNLESAYSTLNGYKTPVSPLPYENQLPKKELFLPR